jgi:hypothetical protein
MTTTSSQAGATAGEVAALIEEVLGIGQMAPDENFFEVGGNSILALTLISQIEQRWATELSLIDVIQNATPELLAGLIAKDAPGASDAGEDSEPALPPDRLTA